MTPAVLRRLSGPDLEQLWSTLRADKLPVGTFDGVAFTRWPVGLLWYGKRFIALDKISTLGRVKNRVGPLLVIEGFVTLWGGKHEVTIDYPQFGLQDRLKPLSATTWLGRMDVAGRTLWFSLEQAP